MLSLPTMPPKEPEEKENRKGGKPTTAATKQSIIRSQVCSMHDYQLSS